MTKNVIFLLLTRVRDRRPRLRLSILTGSVHLADILLQEFAKYARKVFDSPRHASQA